MKKMFLAFAIGMLTVTVTQAQKPEVVTTKKTGWHKIGDARVDFKADKDQFIVLGNDRFKSIQIRIKDAPLHVEDMQIFYEGGDKEDVALKSDFDAGSHSRVIELKGGSAEINKVVFVYNTVPNSSIAKAELELWGLK